VFYVGKAMQVAGLVGVGIALVTGVAQSGTDGAMARELGGAVLGVVLFWAGRIIESR
jgi:hypothetical protein